MRHILNVQALQKIRADAVEEFGENTTAHERVEFIKVDLASLHSVMHFVEEFKRKGYPLHLLICNGAVLMNDKGKRSEIFYLFFVKSCLIF